MKWKEEIISTIKYIAIGLILAVFMNQGLGYALGTQKPVMAVVSNSMAPTFYKGDLVIVRGIDPDQLLRGDIIVYQNPAKGIPIVHRVVKIEDYEGSLLFYTKGDHNFYTDQDPRSGISTPVKGEWINGRVIFIIPKLGYFKLGTMELIHKIS
ncbi:MAG: signal peptidase I [Candidatus Hydrothermarchaeales archaeon]